MEGKGDDTQVSGAYLSRGKHIKTYMTKFVLACRESKEVVDDNTNHRGASKAFLVMNSISHLENSKGDEDHYTSCREVLEDAIE